LKSNHSFGVDVSLAIFRTFTHRVYRFFKFIAIILSLLLLVAQVVSVFFLAFDRVEFVLKLFLCSFSVLIMLNELEWWGMLRDSRLLWNWITRGVSSILLPFSFNILAQLV